MTLALADVVTRERAVAREPELPPPTGTILVLAIYLVALAGMWGAMYLLMLSR